MSALENLSSFEATLAPSLSKDDRDLTLVVVAGTFELPPPGRSSSEPLRVAESQLPVPAGDVFVGDGPSAYLETEGQLSYVRAGTDVYLKGTAHAPDGRPATRGQVGLSLGSLRKGAIVFGDRHWDHGVRGTIPSSPKPYTAFELSWTRCFGGWVDSGGAGAIAAAELNPAGVGNHANENDALGKPLPNFERAEALISSFGDRPKPQGFGPSARHWMPRRPFGGTYDETWVKLRAPRWPPDFDERFFIAAADGLHAAPHLIGGEPVQLVGLAAEGGFGFNLPRRRLLTRFVLHEGDIRVMPTLDAVCLDTDARTVTLIWRASVPRGLTDIRGVVVRELESWEDEP